MRIIKKLQAVAILFIFFCLNANGQDQLEKGNFIFIEFDHLLLEYWLELPSHEATPNQLLFQIEEEWTIVKESILETQIPYFDNIEFAEKQDNRLHLIRRLFNAERFDLAKAKSLSLLKAFSNVRLCYTADEYKLDSILEAFEVYLSVHDIIHDKMMSLYVWNEFIWFVDDLKCKILSMEQQFELSHDGGEFQMMTSALLRLNECLVLLDESLEEAYRPDFEVPCNEMKMAFYNVFTAYLRAAQV